MQYVLAKKLNFCTPIRWASYKICLFQKCVLNILYLHTNTIAFSRAQNFVLNNSVECVLWCTWKVLAPRLPKSWVFGFWPWVFEKCWVFWRAEFFLKCTKNKPDVTAPLVVFSEKNLRGEEEHFTISHYEVLQKNHKATEQEKNHF